MSTGAARQSEESRGSNEEEWDMGVFLSQADYMSLGQLFQWSGAPAAKAFWWIFSCEMFLIAAILEKVLKLWLGLNSTGTKS